MFATNAEERFNVRGVDVGRSSRRRHPKATAGDLSQLPEAGSGPVTPAFNLLIKI